MCVRRPVRTSQPPRDTRNGFIGDDFDRGKILFQSRALDLSGLLGEIALGDQDQIVPLGEVLQGFGDLRQKLHRLLGDGASESANRLVRVRQ